MLKVENASDFFRGIDDWLATVEADLEKVAKGLAAQALYHVLEFSAQYSGDFAANWNVSVNTPDTSFGQWAGRKDWTDKDVEPYIMGDSPARNYAMGEAIGKLSSFKLGDTIWLTNAAEHQEPYAVKIENNRVNFRPGNDGMPVHHTLEMMKIDYGTITRAGAEHLKEMQL